MKRTFLAIPINPGTEYPALVQRLQNGLQHDWINWCRTDQIHLTLKFVGDTPDDDIPEIAEQVRKVAARHKPFAMDFDHTGIFGSRYDPRVLWIGMNNTPKELYELEDDVLDAFDNLGYMRDSQHFVPHITICRIKKLNDKDYFHRIYNTIEQKTYLHADVDKIIYYQSFLRPTGAYYKVLNEFKL